WPLDLSFRIEGIVAQLQGIYPDLDRLLAARERWHQTAPIVAAQMFLRGWEGVEVKFEQRGGKVTEAALSAIPVEDLVAVGTKALGLMQGLAGEPEKN